MGVNRRDFLKITGLGTLAGVGGKVAADLIFKGQAEASEAKPNEGALVGKRWAMVVDTKKCIEKIEKDGCKDGQGIDRHVSGDRPTHGNQVNDCTKAGQEKCTAGDLEEFPVILEALPNCYLRVVFGYGHTSSRDYVPLSTKEIEV